MVRALRILVVLALLTRCLPAQTVLGPAQFSQDLQAVVTQLPKLHVNLFFQISQADFTAAAQQLQADLPGLTQDQFYTRLSALVALPGDAHTMLMLSPTAGFTQLPIALQHFSDGYFVTSAPLDHPSLNRAKLVSIGGASLDTVLSALEPVISHENEYRFQSLAALFLANVGVMRGLGFLPDSGPATYTFQLDSGGQTSVDLSTANPVQTRALDSPSGFIPPLVSSNQNYGSAYWPQSKTVYVRIASFNASDGGQQVAALTLAFLDQNPVDNLIFDVRDDEGGDLSVTFPLLQGLTPRIAKLQANSGFGIFALIDGGSFSSASLLPMILKAGVPGFLVPLAPGIGTIPTTLVGEPTGSVPQTHGNPLTFKLPASGMAVQYSTVQTPAWPGIPPAWDAIYPDIAVSAQSTDYFARHDAMLAAVLARAAAPPSAPTGNAIVVNSASFRVATGIAPGSFASAFGAFPSGALSLTVNGAAAPLIAATPSQLVFMIPASASVGLAIVIVQQGGQTVASGQFQITPSGPGLFVEAPISAQPGAILNQDGNLNTAASPAARGSVLQIFATGYGQARASVWIGNLPATVSYSGQAPGIPGLWQINAAVPNDPSIFGQVPVFLGSQSLVSNGVTVFVGP